MISVMKGIAELAVVSWRAGPSKLCIALVLMVLSGASWPLLAVALSSGVESVQNRDVSGTVWAGCFVGIGIVAVLLLQHFAYLPYVEVAEVATTALELELINLANGTDGIEHHERPKYADRVAVLRQELPQFYDGLVGLVTSVSLVVSAGLTAYLLASVNPWLLVLPLAGLFPAVASRRAQRLLDSARDAGASDLRQALHLFDLSTTARAAKEIRVLGLHRELQHRHRRLWRRHEELVWAAEKRAALTVALGQAIFGLAYIFAVLLVLNDALRSRTAVGDVILVLTLAGQVNQQLTTGLDLFRKLLRVARALMRLEWLRQVTSPRGVDARSSDVPDVTTTGLELKNVSFRYPGTEGAVLEDVNLVIPAGSTVAIVGENGAGKTSLVNLLCRFYEPSEGEILHDNVPIASYAIGEWRKRIAAGLQDFMRFEFSAKQSVGLGDLPFIDDDDRVRAALRRAQAEALVDRLPAGLESHLGLSWAAGSELSGGQWQKIASARAMMRTRPHLVVLDEPTSALDPEAEQVLFERYAALARHRAEVSGAITVLVSHRFSTVQMADIIVVMEQGRVAQVGGHAGLMASGGLYADLYTLQSTAYL